MKKLLANNKGNTLIELIMVMMLLALFGITMYTLIFAGSQTQQKINENKNAQIDARIALNYLNVKLRQNDAAGCIEVVDNPLTGEPAIRLRSNEVPGEEYDTWIYFYDGEILEYIGFPEDTEPVYDFSVLVVKAEDFVTQYDAEGGTIVNTVFYTYNGAQKQMSTTVHLKSGGIK